MMLDGELNYNVRSRHIFLFLSCFSEEVNMYSLAIKVFRWTTTADITIQVNMSRPRTKRDQETAVNLIDGTLKVEKRFR
jgi:hypothetical protein